MPQESQQSSEPRASEFAVVHVTIELLVPRDGIESDGAYRSVLREDFADGEIVHVEVIR